jgi:glycosidase
MLIENKKEYIMKNKNITRILSLGMAAALLLQVTACGQKAGEAVDTADTQASVSAEEATTTDQQDTESDVQKENPQTASDIAAKISEGLPALNIVDDKYRTTYEIFVYSFYDSDGDGIGDLQGVIDKLDYVNDGDDETFTDLGCNEIWLMPISPSPTYHKYDITDYKDIDPAYGTLDDFDKLLDACHERGVRLIIDLVLNHTSSEHQWFKDATKYLRDHPEITELYDASGNAIEDLVDKCPYLYYYNFSKDNQSGYEKVAGTDWYFEARFWSGMPDLNLDDDMVKEEISDITKFWLDRGVDGFRLDAVTSYYTDNDTSNIEFMTWLNDTVKGQKADAYMVGEAWTNLSRYSRYYQSGIDSFFAFELSGSESVIATVARGKKSPRAYAEAIANAEKELAQVREDYIDAPFFTNHDMARAAGYFVGRGSQNMVKMAGALNLLMGGNAFVYYGEELGMKGSGKDENKRAPMQWVSADAGDLTGMCDGPKDMEKFDMIYPSLDEQAADPYSIYNYYKKAIRLRNTFPVIARGKTVPVEELSDDYLGAFVRTMTPENPVIGESGADAEYEPVLVLINNDNEAKSIDLSKWSGAGAKPVLAYQINVGEEASILEGTTLTIPSYGIVVIE